MKQSFILYKRVLGHIWIYWPILIISLVGMILSALTEPLFSYMMKPLIDVTLSAPDPNRMYEMPLMIVGVFFLRAIATYLNEVSTTWLSAKLVCDLRTAMFARVLDLPLRFFHEKAGGQTVATIAYNVEQVAEAGFSVLTILVKDSITLIGLLSYLLYIDWQLTLICVAVIPPVATGIAWSGKRLRNFARQWNDTQGKVTQVLNEAINAQRVIKIFGGQSHEKSRFNQLIGHIRHLSFKQSSTSALNSGLTQFLIAVAFSCIVYFASVRALNKQLTVGDFVSFMTAMLALFAPIKKLTNVNQYLQRGLAAAEKVFELIDSPPEVDVGRQCLPQAQGILKFDEVSFRYAEDLPFVINDFSLTVAAGERIAVVGTSGSGKTTLLSLIPRFFDPVLGKIYLDGMPLDSYSLATLRSHIALVSQEIVLFNDTVFNNIAYGPLLSHSKEDVYAAAKAAHAFDFIQALPEGFSTNVGDQGIRLSGGQRQRIAIARAILKNAPILLLDEATSALDTESEREVQIALDELMENRTTFVIAHRLSTIQNATRIVVMDQGKVCEVGKHQELLALDGVYANLYRLQFADHSVVYSQ